MDNWDDDDDVFFWRRGPTKPIKVQGGIKAQAKKFGNQWWAQKWLEAVENFGPEKRVARGRSYARKGQVLDLKIDPGVISATVQGSREKPYEIEIPLNKISEEQGKVIVQELRNRPVYTASLLSGEMHPEFENVFLNAGFSLFPTKVEGSNARCSCPDSAAVCKHIAAVYYLISEELGRDPLLLLHLRGFRRDQLSTQSTPTLFAVQELEPLPSDPQQFWKAPRVKEIPIARDHHSPSTRQKPPILQRLGTFPFWRGETEFLGTLERIYEAAQRFISGL